MFLLCLYAIVGNLHVYAWDHEKHNFDSFVCQVQVKTFTKKLNSIQCMVTVYAVGLLVSKAVFEIIISNTQIVKHINLYDSWLHLKYKKLAAVASSGGFEDIMK